MFHLVRLTNCLLSACGVLVGAYLTRVCGATAPVILAAIATFFACAAGNTFNDISDVEADRINRPKRALPSGAISIQLAGYLTVGFAVIGLCLAYLAGGRVFGIVVLELVLLATYSLWLKRVPFLSNVIVAILGGMIFLTGGLAVDLELTFVLPGPLIAASFAFLLHLVREIVKDALDIEGDKAVGVKTLPIVVGVSLSIGIAFLFLCVLIMLTLFPTLNGWFGKAYTVIAVCLVDLPLLVVLQAAWWRPSPVSLQLSSLVLKIAMFFGLVALVLA